MFFCLFPLDQAYLKRFQIIVNIEIMQIIPAKNLFYIPRVKLGGQKGEKTKKIRASGSYFWCFLFICIRKPEGEYPFFRWFSAGIYLTPSGSLVKGPGGIASFRGRSPKNLTICTFGIPCRFCSSVPIWRLFAPFHSALSDGDIKR